MTDAPISTDVVLDVRGLAKRYPGAAESAVQDLSLQLHRGEVLGVLGPNGAGKTTMLEILTGFRARSAGEVRLLGLDPGDRRQLRELRRRVGVVLQQTGHYRYLTARETLAMHHAWHAEPRSVEEVLALVGLEEHADRTVRQLSGGQQRRLDVGVALVGRPDVIFLDEPTTGFDPAARRRTWDVVEELARLGTSVVLTTHYMEEASRLADRLVVLAGGRIVGEGTPAQIAAALQLGTVIRVQLPSAVEAHELPDLARDGLGTDGRYELRVEDPAPVLAALCGWAVDADVDLTGLEVTSPSLEESYLALTGPSAVTGLVEVEA